MQTSLATAYHDRLARRLANWEADTPLRFPGWDDWNGWNDWDENGVLKPGIGGYDRFIRGAA